MVAKVILFSSKSGEIYNFLNKFYGTSITLSKNEYLSWKRDFPNPIDISDIIAAFSDNNTSFDIDMWISLDKDVFIKISPQNVNLILKYIFERYPY